MDIDTPPVEANADDPYMGLSVNSLVEVTLAEGNSYGIIRWIGALTDQGKIMAGLELVSFTLTCYCADSKLKGTCLATMFNSS